MTSADLGCSPPRYVENAKGTSFSRLPLRNALRFAQARATPPPRAREIPRHPVH